MMMTEAKIMKAIAGTQFEADMVGNTISINDSDVPRGYWNLILSIRDCSLYSKGIKPHRNWRITDVKRYFGVKGSASKIHEVLEAYRDFLMPKEEVS